MTVYALSWRLVPRQPGPDFTLFIAANSVLLKYLKKIPEMKLKTSNELFKKNLLRVIILFVFFVNFGVPSGTLTTKMNLYLAV